MQFETYISDLLYRYDCVTVPEFGAFLTQRKSATVHDFTNAFYPPQKIVSFNEQLQNNDGLLARYIADVEKIPFEVALQNIAIRVKFFKSYLTEGKTLTIDHIGDLKLNDEGKIQFTPSNQLNYLTESFGLSQFVSPAVLREVYKKEVETIEKEVPTIAIMQEKRKSNPYLKYAAIAIITLGLSGFGVTNYYKNIENHNQIAQEEADAQLEDQIQEATFVIPNPLPTVTLTLNKQRSRYHIIAGAFRLKENSDKKIEQLMAQGYNPKKIGVNKYGLHQVAYASYTSRTEAYEALNRIRKDSNKEAWLLVTPLD